MQDVELEVLKQLIPPVHLLFVFPLLEREGALEHHLLLRILELLCRLDEALPVDLLQPVPEDLLLELIIPITVMGCLIDYKLDQADDPLKL